MTVRSLDCVDSEAGIEAIETNVKAGSAGEDDPSASSVTVDLRLCSSVVTVSSSDDATAPELSSDSFPNELLLMPLLGVSSNNGFESGRRLTRDFRRFKEELTLALMAALREGEVDGATGVASGLVEALTVLKTSGTSFKSIPEDDLCSICFKRSTCASFSSFGFSKRATDNEGGEVEEEEEWA